jgi:HD-like signal output (HDOD) protein
VGLETTKALVLLAHTFSFFKDLLRTPFSMELLGEHSLAVGREAQRLARQERAGAELADQAFTAGLLHDLGKLFFAANLPKEFSAALRISQGEDIPLHESEQRVFGTTHAAVAGFVLGTWHLPDPIVDAVAWHHCPSHNPDCPSAFTPLTAVHLANVLDHQSRTGRPGLIQSRADAAYLERLGLGHWISNGLVFSPG